jgi:hypothetical protein
MPRLTIGQKAQRVLRFLMGLRNPGVVAALSQHGFTEADLRIGVERLTAVTRSRLQPTSASEDPSLVQALDAFENRWFQIARVTLDHHYPAVSEQLFSNLVQTSGVEVAVSVSTFIERLAEMAAGTGAYAPDGPAARALLVQRGLTDERVAEAKALVDELSKLIAVVEPQGNAEDKQAAEQALWAWYLEWSGIARATIHDRRMLRALGFRKAQRGEGEEEIEAEEPQVQPPALPANAGGAGPAAPSTPGARP